MNTLKKTCQTLALFAIVVAARCDISNAQALRISAVNDILRSWSPNQHLYVKGDLGIRSEQLARLEQWLDENAQHWTVVLMRSAAGEAYRSVDGRNFRGMDAVEFALGQGLPSQTGFGEWEHPSTGETDGAVFVLFLEERKFSYFSSVAQDRRRLGQSNWIRGLDREAIRAMRNGGRVIDAVKNTVKLIDGKLQNSIAAEALNEARKKQEREQSISELKRSVADAETKLISQVETASEKLREAYPAADGQLTKPPIDQWRVRLRTAMENLDDDNLRSTEKETQAVINEVQEYLDDYADHESIDQMVERVETNAIEIGDGPNNVAKPMLAKSEQLLAEAHRAHAEGRMGIDDLVNQAQDQLERARTAVKSEQERIRVAAARKKVIQKTALGASGVTGCGLGIGLILLNRRRKPAKQRAASALSERVKSVESEMDKVYGLIERSSEILGSKEKVAARGYAGTTRKLSDRTLEDVDDLLVMSTEVERVMDEARELIEPKSPVGKVSNMFSGSRYERGVNRISGEPLQFTRAKGLPLVIKRDSEQKDGEEPESISMTFEEVFSAFHERSASASETLDLIEGSLLDVNDRLSELQARINHASDLDERLAAAADDDGYFRAPALFEEAIPAAQTAYDKADAISATDPVFAIQEHIPAGWRIITESLSVAEAINRARDEVFPKLDKSAPKLEELGYDVKWMEQSVFELGERADKLFQVVGSESIAEAAKTFSYDVTSLGERAEQSVALAENLRDENGPAIESLQGKVVAARTKIASTLGINESAALHEHERDPDVSIAKSKELVAAASAALNHGGIEAAGRAVKVLNEQIAEGHQFVDGTLESLGVFESDVRSCESAFESVRGQLPRHEKLVADNEEAYSPTSLVLRAGDPGMPDATSTIGTHLVGAQDLLNDVQRMISDASTVHTKGKVLEAAAMLVVANNSTDEASELLQDIARHCALLESRSRENLDNLTRMVQRTKDMATQIKDPRTQQPTISQFEKVVRDIQSAQKDIEGSATNRDPFRDAATMAQLTEELEVVDSLIIADRNAHAEATRAVDGAKSQHRTAEGLVRESRADQLPDTSAVQACQREIISLGETLKGTERRLNVAHDDWQSVDSEAARINADLGVAAGRLRDELQMAQQSVEALKLASQEVFDAARWTGGYGIRVSGSPGSHELERARRALKSADYGHMMQMSRAAIMSARQAVQMAQREVARRQREAQRIAEAARRRRRAAAARRAASSGSILGGGISRGGGSSRSSSGSWSGRSSSSSGSGSGFSRSGW